MESDSEQTKILEELNNNIGTQQYFNIPFSNLVYTEGIKALIDKCRCYWLISDFGILLNSKKELLKPFLILTIKVNEDKTAIITLKEDSDLKPIYTKKYNYTDFPLKEYEFYIINEVMLLKSEY